MPEPTSTTAEAAGEPAAASPSTLQPPSHAPVHAPEKAGPAYTIDNRIGYRVEDIKASYGHRRQIRFADREGGHPPDDELLAPIRQEKPELSRRRPPAAWQARKRPEGLHAIGRADDALAEIGRKRAGGHER